MQTAYNQNACLLETVYFLGWVLLVRNIDMQGDHLTCTNAVNDIVLRRQLYKQQFYFTFYILSNRIFLDKQLFHLLIQLILKTTIP